MNASSQRYAWAVFLVLGLQLFSRFAGAPVTDFSNDDWIQLHLGATCNSAADIGRLMMDEPDRPFYVGAICAAFRILGDRPWLYSLYSALINSLTLLLSVRLAFLLTGSRRLSLIHGTIFALLPNLTENFHWEAMTVVDYMQAANLGCALAWILFLQSGRNRWWIVSFLCYGLALPSYEYGIGIPFILLLLVEPKRWVRMLPRLLPYAAIAAFYLAWKLTLCFGHGHGVFTSPRKPSFNLYDMYWNVKEIASWWFLDRFWACVLNGWSAVATLRPWPARLLAAASIAAVAVMFRELRRWREVPAEGAWATWSKRRVILFALAWIVVGHAICIVAWVESRMIFLPAFGVCLLAAIVVESARRPAWRPALALLAVMFLMANHGTAINWRDAGLFQRRLYNHLLASEPEWGAKKYVVFDTRELRQRLTPGLLKPTSGHPLDWAFYGNAEFFRSSHVRAMMKRVRLGQPIPEALHDVEHGARVDGGALRWHDWFDASQLHEDSAENAFVVDCWSVGTGAN